MTFEEVFAQVDSIEGWMGKDDCKALWAYAQNVSGLIVEIGSYMGRSTKLLALASPESNIVAIDSYKETVFSSVDPVEVKRRFFESVAELRVTLIHEDSHKVGKKWKQAIDFLVVDGDHLYEAVKKDILNFVPHVKQGCFVLFHDYNEKRDDEEYQPNSHGVFRAVNELKKRYFSDVEHNKEKNGFAICRRQ
jgi:predicted O-methyltransferase YrrM